MNKTLRSIVGTSTVAVMAAVVLVGLFVATTSSAAARGRAGGAGGSGGSGGQALGPLSAAEVDALTAAIEEEYLAMNTYQAVMEQFGAIEPFERIARSEQQHAKALARLFEKYGLSVPENPGLSTVPTWDSVAAACRTGVEAEIADAGLYDALEPEVSHPDILRVFGNLRRASLENHLPAFESCD